MIGSLQVADLNEALPAALPMLLRHGKPHTAASVANQRPTLEWPGVFITEYTKPMRNVLFDPVRDANPFFHYLEAMWIIAGRRDLRFLKHLLPRYADYSDDGATLHGAYGFRLRYWPGEYTGASHHKRLDQVKKAMELLHAKPDTRQVVMSIWDPVLDLGRTTKDMPCNDMIMAKVRDGKLNITVNNRSNDAIWGCYGANAVQFSMLQGYMAAKLGLGVGTYTQVSDSFHVYEDNSYWQWFKEMYTEDQNSLMVHNAAQLVPYREIGDTNLFADPFVHLLDEELEGFFATADHVLNHKIEFIEGSPRTAALRNAQAMWNCLAAYRKYGATHEATRAWAEKIVSSDWQFAVLKWLDRRAAKVQA